MTRYAPLVLAVAIALLFVAPWPLPSFIVLLISPVIPLAPLALGIMFDALYRAPGMFPLASVLGALGTVIAYFVRKRLGASIIGE